MRQLITRVEPDLHLALKERAAAAGLSLNTFVVRILADAVAVPLTERERWKAWARGEGLVVQTQGTPDPDAREAAIRQTRGIGPIADDLMRAIRSEERLDPPQR